MLFALCVDQGLCGLIVPLLNPTKRNTCRVDVLQVKVGARGEQLTRGGRGRSKGDGATIASTVFRDKVETAYTTLRFQETRSSRRRRWSKRQPMPCRE